VESVAAWTGQRKYDIDQLLVRLIRRTEALRLRVCASDTHAALDVAAFVTAVASKLYRAGVKEEQR
jgi:hypothetical protein